MAGANKCDKGMTATNKHFTPLTIIKCYQINLQNSKTATDNLMELIEKEEIDVDFILEPYTGCPRRNVPDFGRVFLMLNYTDITQNTYIQS